MLHTVVAVGENKFDSLLATTGDNDFYISVIYGLKNRQQYSDYYGYN